jgi:hypothetical protein
MGFPSIVCPNSEVLLQRFTGRSVALRLKSGESLAAGLESIRKSGNTLFCVILESDRPLAEIAFEDSYQGVPLAVMAPALGNFRNLARHLDRLRKFNLRVYLPGDRTDNLVSLRILSSVGIHAGAVLRQVGTDWEPLADLATYALLGQVPHATIEPFSFIAANYQAGQNLDWGRVIFDDPRHFLHLDRKGRVALSPAELAKKHFVAQSVGEIGAPDEFPPIRERLRSWRHYFTDNRPCAFCTGWKICLGKFSQGLSENAGCAEFFTEMIGLVRQHTALKVAPQEPRLWQP